MGNPDDGLRASLRRFEEAVERAEKRDAELVAALGQSGAPLSRDERKRLLKERKRLRRELRRGLRRNLAGPGGWVPGFITSAASIGFFGLAATHLQTHLFVGWFGLAFGLMALRLHRARREAMGTGEASAPVAVATPAVEDPRVAKVDALCDRILAELGRGPQVLRDFVHKPEETVAALRRACHELARRERALRSVITAEDDARLERERAELAARIAGLQDPVSKERLGGALAALDEQRRQRAELGTAATRLEAEHTRLYYTLEGLHTQVLRARAADAAGEDVAGVGLRKSLETLSAEIDAVADSIEAVHAPAAMEPIAELDGGGEAARRGGTRERG